MELRTLQKISKLCAVLIVWSLRCVWLGLTTGRKREEAQRIWAKKRKVAATAKMGTRAKVMAGAWAWVWR
jgi:hypothetical protein